jgi:hypothetical protein
LTVVAASEPSPVEVVEGKTVSTGVLVAVCVVGVAVDVVASLPVVVVPVEVECVLVVVAVVVEREVVVLPVDVLELVDVELDVVP